MNQRGWSLSSYIGYAVLLLIFVLVIAFNVIKLNNRGVVDIDSNGGTIMNGENNVSDYSSAEKAVVDALKGYRADKYKKKHLNDSIVVTVNELVDGSYLKKLVLNGAVCTGYGIISNSDGINYDYESYIRCGEYTTNGYTSSLDK